MDTAVCLAWKTDVLMKKTAMESISLIIPDYIQVEREILRRVRDISNDFCARCVKKCCAEAYCRESFQSRFLSRLVRMQKVTYDQKKGWLGPQGCRLEYGRPMVCYEFFCDDFLTDRVFMSSDIRGLIKDFVNIGSRARGTTHLICIDNLKSISPQKINKMRQRISELNERLTERCC